MFVVANKHLITDEFKEREERRELEERERQLRLERMRKGRENKKICYCMER